MHWKIKIKSNQTTPSSKLGLKAIVTQINQIKFRLMI